MRFLPRRLGALLTVMAVLGGHPALCGASARVPEGRMACCPPDAACPMHAAAGRADDAILSAAAPAADCCTASPSRRADTTAGGPVRPAGMDLPGVSGAPVGPLLALRRAGIPAGAHAPPLRRHALLSVYLL